MLFFLVRLHFVSFFLYNLTALFTSRSAREGLWNKAFLEERNVPKLRAFLVIDCAFFPSCLS